MRRLVKNPEDDICDEIDRLVNEQLKIGPVDDYSTDRYPKCPNCTGPWHGQPNSLGCHDSFPEKVHREPLDRYQTMMEQIVDTLSAVMGIELEVTDRGTIS